MGIIFTGTFVLSAALYYIALQITTMICGTRFFQALSSVTKFDGFSEEE